MSVWSRAPVKHLRVWLGGFDSSRLRPVLMIGVPALVIVIAGTIYLLSGRYISTDNAYVKADMVAVSPKVAGTITNVFVEENQFVEKETPLFQIDPTDYRILLQEAEAQLKQAVAKVKGQQARYRMTLERIELAKSSADYYQREFDRQNTLARRDFVSRQKLDEAKHNLDTARHLKDVDGESGRNRARPTMRHSIWSAPRSARLLPVYWESGPRSATRLPTVHLWSVSFPGGGCGSKPISRKRSSPMCIRGRMQR